MIQTPLSPTVVDAVAPAAQRRPFTVIENVKGQRVPITPPAYVDDTAIALSPNSIKVLEKRYLRRDINGDLLETPAGMFYRLAYHLAQVEKDHEGDVEATTRTFYDLLTERRFYPNSPTFTGAGTPLGQLAACFVIPIADDMGKESDGIFSTLRVAALIQQTGGGNGFSFSRLRPKDDVVHTSSGRATGPVGFLRVYDQAFGEIAQGGCLLPDTLVFTDKGLLRLDEIVNVEKPGWQSHTYQMATDEGWRTSQQGYNNGIAPILRVHTNVGLSLAGTADHRVKVMTDDGPEWRTLQSLQRDDWLLVRLGQHSGKLQALRQPQRQHGNQNWPTLPNLLDEEFAFFLGYLAGDGFIAAQPNDHRIGVSVAHSSYLMVEMPMLLERLFGVPIHKQQKPNDRSVTFVIDNRAVKDFLQSNGLNKQRSRQVTIPRLIRQSSSEVVGAYLRGLFEADGSMSHGYPSLMTTSPRLAEEVSTLLIGLGAPASIRSIAPGIHKLGTATVYQIRIQSAVGLQVWRERIGCDQRSRFVAAYSWESNEQRESVYPLPAPAYWLQPVLDAITLEQIDQRGRGMGVKLRSEQPRLRRALLRYLRGDRQFTRSGYDLLRLTYPEFAEHARSPEGFWFVKVTDVVSDGEALTLDLEVDDNHTYLANGVVTHNSRRGANMAVLRCDHPDIEEFITCKAEEGKVSNFNISVAITDEFMVACKNDTDFALRNPRDGKVWRMVRARDLFAKIVKYAHHNGEPGALFIDAANRSNPVPHLYELEATNPCGEQWLGPYENCCLGSVNLAEHVTLDPDGDPIVDWDLLRRSVEESTHFLDNVVSINAYVPSVPEVAQAAYRARRIGLGIMGLGDMMYKLGIRYGSEEGQEFAAQLMEFVRYYTMDKSIALAKERSAFLAFADSIYDDQQLGGMKWQPPQPVAPFSRDWYRPTLDWNMIIEGIRRHGIRNAAQTTVAPTGTIATVCGCEGYGCEPVFALGYIRHFKDGDKDVELAYTSPLFEQALEATNLSEARKAAIKQHAATYGNCQSIEGLPEHLRHTFVVSNDITAEEHVRMQAAIQAFVDNSISKCITGDTLVLTTNGLIPISELSEMRLPDQFAELAIDVVSPHGIEQTAQFYYGGYRETRKISLEYGFTLEGTGNHQIHVLAEDGSVQFRRLDELKLGDMAILYTDHQRFGRAGGALPGYSGKSRTNSKTITFPRSMNEDFALLLGSITSEGAITINGVAITNNDTQLLQQLNDICQQLFGFSGTIFKDKRNQVHTLQINSRTLRNWLLVDLGLEAGAEHKIIPTCILGASHTEIAAFLRGLFLDGYMTQDGKLFGITLASETLIRQLQTLLLNMGVLGTVRQNTDRAWGLTVQGGELEMLADQISFVEVWKNERIAKRNLGRLQRYRNYSRLLPPVVTQALHELRKQSPLSLRALYSEGYTTIDEQAEQEYQRVRVNLLQGHRLSRRDGHKVYEYLRNNERALSYIDTFFGHDCPTQVYVEVQSIATGYAEVFDINVPGSHSFIANGLGNHNTCNFPEGATEEDVTKAYQLAWELGCKGLTVYVTGSRQQVVLETKATQQKKTEGESVALNATSNGATSGTHDNTATGYSNSHVTSTGKSHSHANDDVKPLMLKRPRPKRLQGSTYRKETPLGSAYITVNSDERNEPFEVFLNVGKAGSEVAAVSEAMGRLVSLVLRIPSSLPPSERLRWIMDEMAGIGGGRPLGFGANRVRSLPDGIAQVLAEHLSELPPAALELQAEQLALPIAERPIGDICPECGEASFLNVEGCRKCHVCGYSEC